MAFTPRRPPELSAYGARCTPNSRSRRSARPGDVERRVPRGTRADLTVALVRISAPLGVERSIVDVARTTWGDLVPVSPAASGYIPILFAVSPFAACGRPHQRAVDLAMQSTTPLPNPPRPWRDPSGLPPGRPAEAPCRGRVSSTGTCCGATLTTPPPSARAPSLPSVARPSWYRCVSARLQGRWASAAWAYPPAAPTSSNAAPGPSRRVEPAPHLAEAPPGSPPSAGPRQI
jgi:hypothetical protein